MLGKYQFIRNIEGDTYRENFFVAAISSMLAIRFYLYVTGYPQIGGGDFHIAHMLWGGFIMMFCLIIVFSFLNKHTLHLASILGGIGFGTFIDELGKFITTDNDYFFQPTVAIIYVIFVLMYLGMKAIGRYPKVSKKEYLINAFHLTQDAVLNDLDKQEEKKALAFLRKADKENPITIALRSLLHEVEAIAPPKPGPLMRLFHRLRNIYHAVTNWQRIMAIVVAVFSVNALYIAIWTGTVLMERPELSFSAWGRLLSSILSGIFVLAGLLLLRRSRLRGYRYFKVSILINIFLTQVFVFYQEQFEALIGLAVYMFLLLLVNFGIDREREKVVAELTTQSAT